MWSNTPCGALWALVLALFLSSSGLSRATKTTNAANCYDYESLRASLVAHIPFDGDARDASGNGVDGVTTNPPDYVFPGRVGAATGRFDQLRRHHVRLISPAFNFDTNVDFTMSLWIRPFGMPYSEDRLSFHDPAIMGTQDWTSSRNRGVLLAAEQAGRFFFIAGDGTSRLKFTGQDGFLTNGEWMHILVSANRSSNVVLYANNAAVFTGDIRGFAGKTTHNLTSGYDMVIGSDGLAGAVYPSWFNGDIDDVAVWTRALSPAEAAAVFARGALGRDMHSGLPASCEDTVAVCGVASADLPASFRITCPPGCAQASNNGASTFDVSTSICGAAAAQGLAARAASGPNATVTVMLSADRTQFTLGAVCGDSVVAGDEECDDGLQGANDGCANCKVTRGYVCAGSGGVGDAVSGGPCATACGDGIVAGTEQCDPAANSEGCFDDCTAMPGYLCATSHLARSRFRVVVCTPTYDVCGDGERTGAEECDDGNGAGGDGCSASCAVEADWVCEPCNGGTRDVCREPLFVVASGGDDAGNCTMTVPCATIHVAVARLAALPSSALVLIGNGTYAISAPIVPRLPPGRKLVLRSPSRGAVLDCGSSGAALLVAGNDVVLDGLTVQRCAPGEREIGSVVVLDGSAVVTSCTFTDNHSNTAKSDISGRAGALCMRSSGKGATLRISDSTFVGNSVDPFACRFMNGMNGYFGQYGVFEVSEGPQDSPSAAGAVLADGIDVVEIHRCRFAHNRANAPSAGGAVYVRHPRGAARVTVTDSDFDGNMATGEKVAAAALLVTSEEAIAFINDAELAVRGCAFTKGAAIIRPSTIPFPRAYVAGAVGIFFRASACHRARQTVANCSFERNSASLSSYSLSAAAGAVTVMVNCFGDIEGFRTEVTGSVFNYNAAIGSALDNSLVAGSVTFMAYRGHTSNNVFSARANVFTNDAVAVLQDVNSNTGAGGSIAVGSAMAQAVYAADEMTTTKNVYEFVNNTHSNPRADVRGKEKMAAAGAVCRFHTTQNAGHVHTDNKATVVGMVVRNATVFLSASMQSVAAGGFASLFVGGSLGNTMAVLDSEFSSSSAYLETKGSSCLGAGGIGVLFVSADAGSTFTLARTAIVGNAVDVLTGSSSGGVGVLFDESSANHTVSVVDCAMCNNVAGGGSGALEFVARTGTDMVLRCAGTVFTSNRGRKGAGVLSMIADSANCTITDSTFSGNAGSVSGGALYFEGRMSARVTDSRFVQNEARVGGAVYVSRLAQFAAINCDFYNNDASSGSDVYAGGGDVDLVGSVMQVPRAVTSIAVLGATTKLRRVRSAITCPAGHYFTIAENTALELSCQKCARGMYMVANGTDTSVFGCSACPAGALCSGGDHIRPVSRHWGNPSTRDASYLVCPPGYCCATAAACDLSPCAPHRSGPLCSDCDSGMGVSLMRRTCVDNSDCHDGAWLIPVLIVAIAVLVALLLVFPVGDSGGLRVIAGFAFSAFIVLSFAGNPDAESVLAIVGISTLQFTAAPDLRTDVCIRPGIDSLGNVFFELVGPLVLGALAVSYVMYWQLGRMLAACKDRLRRIAPARKFPAGMLYAVFVLALPPLLSTVARLVHCVEIDGEMRLYEMASVRCFDHGWQIAAFASLLVFAAAPLLLATALWHHRPPPTPTSEPSEGDDDEGAIDDDSEGVADAVMTSYMDAVNNAEGDNNTLDDTFGIEPSAEIGADDIAVVKAPAYCPVCDPAETDGEKGALSEGTRRGWRGHVAMLAHAAHAPYLPEFFYWDVAVLVYRMAFTLCGVLITDPGVRIYVLCFLLWAAFLANWHLCPWRYRIDAGMEAVSLIVLVVVATFQVREACVLSLGYDDDQSARGASRMMSTSLVALQAICLFALLAMIVLRVLLSAATAYFAGATEGAGAAVVAWAWGEARGWDHAPELRQPPPAKKRTPSRKIRERIADANAKTKQYYGGIESEAVVVGAAEPAPVAFSSTPLQQVANAVPPAPLGSPPTSLSSADMSGRAEAAAENAIAAHVPTVRRVSFLDGAPGEDVVPGARLSTHRALVRTTSDANGARRGSLRRAPGHRALGVTHSDPVSLLELRRRRSAPGPSRLSGTVPARQRAAEASDTEASDAAVNPFVVPGAIASDGVDPRTETALVPLTASGTAGEMLVSDV